MKLSHVLAPLRHGPFARYMAGEFTSMIGTWMQVFAQGWVVTSLTNDARVLGWLTFTAYLPMILLTLIGGQVADRHDKRLILLLSLAVQFLSAATIGYLIGHHQILIWHIFVAAAALGIANAFEVPAVAAIVPELVPKEEMSGAIAIDRSSFHLTRLLGPSAGGYLMARFGDAVAYYINAASFLALGLALWSLPRRLRAVSEVSPAPADGGAKPSDIAVGLAYVRGDGPTRTMILLMSAMTCFVSPFVIITMPIYSRLTFGPDPRLMGYLLAFSGVGSLVGSLGLLSIPPGRRTLALKCAAGCIALALCGLAAAHTLPLAVPPLILLTIGLSVTFGTANIIIQERAPDAMRGRVSSVAALSYFGVVTFSGVLITSAINLFGIRPALCGGAIGYAIVAALLLMGREQLTAAPARE